jgi:hypothetical protein
MDGAESRRQGWDLEKHGRVRNLRFLPSEGEVDELMMRALMCLANKSDVGDEIMKEWEYMIRAWIKDGI